MAEEERKEGFLFGGGNAEISPKELTNETLEDRFNIFVDRRKSYQRTTTTFTSRLLNRVPNEAYPA
jgi:hypothetical protein